MKRLFLLVACLVLCITSFGVAGEIKDTESASHGQEASVQRVVESYAFPGFKVVQITLPVLSVYTYLLISEGEALVVDPVRDIGFCLEIARKESATIKGVYLTHSHADFVAGHVEIKNVLNVPIYQSHRSGAMYPFQPVDENSSIKIGSATVRFIDTPGHTPDGQCCAVYSKEDSSIPKLLFTGDVLFVGSVGRPDLLEGTVSAAWLASAMYDSWTTKLSRLPDSVMVFPAHGAGSLCGAHLSDAPVSTIGNERRSNPYLQAKGRGEFVALVLQGLPEAPPYFQHNARLNREGPPLVDWNAPLPTECKPSLELTDPGNCWLVDIRDAKTYAAGHIPNSVNIGVRGRFETWIGTMVPWGARLVLVGDEGLLKEALQRLHRVGYSAEIVTFSSWLKAGLPVREARPITSRELYTAMQNGVAPLIVDVRLPSEWMALRIGTVLNLPLNHLTELSSKLDPAQPVVLVCNSAYRSSMAIGILERKGFKEPRSLDGGSEAWMRAGLPVYEGEKPTEMGLIPEKAVPKAPSAGESGETGTPVPQIQRTPRPRMPNEGC